MIGLYWFVSDWCFKIRDDVRQVRVVPVARQIVVGRASVCYGETLVSGGDGEHAGAKHLARYWIPHCLARVLLRRLEHRVGCSSTVFD